MLAFARVHVTEFFGNPNGSKTVLSGMLLGVLVSTSSVGAGAIGVTFLFLLYPRIPLARIVGSDIAMS
jgi:uncharacterized protein